MDPSLRIKPSVGKVAIFGHLKENSGVVLELDCTASKSALSSLKS